MSKQTTSATGRDGQPIAALASFVLLAGTAGAFSFLSNADGVNAVLLWLVLLAVGGICASFAFSAGLSWFSREAAGSSAAKTICGASTDGLMVTGPGGEIIYANAAYMSLAGARSLVDCRAVERLFSGSPEISGAMYRLARAARNGEAHVENVREDVCMSAPLNGRDGAVWYKIKTTPLAISTGRACLWCVADVTRERQRQEELFQEWRHAIDFLDHAPAGFFSCHRDGKVSYMNATLAGWLGLDPAEAGCGGLDPASFGAAPGAPAPGAPGEVHARQLDIELKRRDGTSFPARVIHSAAFDQDGRPSPSRTLVLNRAPDEEPAGEPDATQTRFAPVFNATPMAIAILDKSGRIMRSNAAFARLMPEALKQPDGPARSIFAGILGRDRAALETALGAAFRSTPDIVPVDAGLAGEGERSARLFVSAAEEHGGNGVTIYALDTTEQRTLQSNFAQSQKMQAIGQLAGGIAHDFNNVLTAIIGYSDLLLANHRPTDPSFQDINQIKQNANRAASLVRQLLAFSRRQTLRPQVLQLGDVLADLQMLMRRLVGEKTGLELRHGRDLWLVEADVNQFEHVLVNLIVNARDAMPEGGKIICRTRNLLAADCASFNETSLIAADYVAIEVEDFGHGIAPDVKDKIFEPFFTTKEVGKGTGLGLAMVYGIVKQTGGYVFCSSTIGKGTVFTILLPRYIPNETHAPRCAEQAIAPAADLTGHGTILLVEDEEAVRAFGARALTSRGYTVLQAASGIEALEIVEQNGGKIDLIVSDVVMPEMDGPTMFGELRKRGIKAKVILVSGYAEDAFSKNLPEGEDFGFLPKPFSLKQLIEAVKGQQ